MQWKVQKVNNSKIDKEEKKIRYFYYLHNYKSSLCFQITDPCKRDWMKNDCFTILNDFVINSDKYV